ncbi:hypothetical protein Tco_0889816, partial [Tanacetum coccineum]
MSDKSSSLKCRILERWFEMDFSKEKSIFTYTMDYYANIFGFELTTWRESHVSRFDRVILKSKCQRYLSEMRRQALDDDDVNVLDVFMLGSKVLGLVAQYGISKYWIWRIGGLWWIRCIYFHGYGVSMSAVL